MDKFVIRSSSTPDLASNSSKRPREEAEQWQHPKRFAIPRPVSRENDISTSNRFSSLKVDNEVLQSFRSATNKKAFGQVPPIVLELREAWVHQNLKDIIDKYVKNYHIEYKGNNRVKIQCYSSEGHQAVKSGLLNENASFHTFTRKDEKLPKVVIKGLPGNLLDSLAADLKSLGFPGATATLIKTSKPVQCPPILVQLPSGTNMVKFKQIKYIANCVIAIQRYKTTNKMGTQCFRCQGFGHASRNCSRTARCVKCSLEHPTSQCPKQGFIESVRCCNCQQAHPANYSQCKERLKYLERIKSKRESFRNTIANSKVVKKPLSKALVNLTAARDPMVAQSTTSWPHLLPSNAVKRPDLIQAPQPIGVIKTSAPSAEDQLTPRDAITNEMLQILTIIKDLKHEFIKCQSFIDKVILIMSHVGHYF